MSRYLGLSLDTSFSFGILPGVCREAMCRRDWIYTDPECYNTKKTYSWSRKHHEKIDKTRFMESYYGTAPFLWDLAKIATEEAYEPEGSLFYIPRDDQVTIRCDDITNVQDAIDWAPRPVRFLLPWRRCDVWKEWDKLRLPEGSEFVQMIDRETRQFTLSRLLLQSEHVFIPWPGTDVYYAEFLNKQIHMYDKLEYYRTKNRAEMEEGTYNLKLLNYLKWGWDYLNDKQKEFFSWTNNWSQIAEDDRKFLTQKMLGLDALKSPQQLYDDLQRLNYLTPDQIRVSDDYQTAYEWLREKTIKFAKIKCSETCTVMYDTI